MGVPALFGWLRRRHPDIAVPADAAACDTLFLDWNGGIHPACRSVLEGNAHRPREELEAAMVSSATAYLARVVRACPPRRGLYVAIDGVAPRAKMNQQRSRRYKAMKERRDLAQIRAECGGPAPTASSWDTNAISAGTLFMQRLVDALREALKADPLLDGLEVHLSDCTRPSEGEHKIAREIRRRAAELGETVVYGLDADLLFLSLSTRVRGMRLLREDDRREGAFFCVDIDRVREAVCSEMRGSASSPEALGAASDDVVVDDFTFLCFMLGNDFLPRVPSLHIRLDGIRDLARAYAEVVLDGGAHLTERPRVHLSTLAAIAERMGATEGLAFGRFHRRFEEPKRASTRADAYERAEEDYHRLIPAPYDPVEMHKAGWKRRYRAHMFGEAELAGVARSAVYEYVRGMLWVWAYYTDDLPSWTWSYTRRAAPILSDLANVLRRAPYKHAPYVLGRPLRPLQQLLAVLPPQSFGLLPRGIARQATAIGPSGFPETFEEDTLLRVFRWEAAAILPHLDMKLLKAHTERAAKSGQQNREWRRDLSDFDCLRPRPASLR